MKRGDMVYVTAHNAYGIVDHVGERTILVRELYWHIPHEAISNGECTLTFTDIVWVRPRDVVEFIPPKPPLRAA